MKDRLILMTPENAQKCHDGTKTQTRRIVKDFGAFHNGVLHCGGKHGLPKALCPYGVVGDRLWVREPFTIASEGMEDQSVIYKGDPMFTGMTAFDWKWTPSIHMPRRACRTVLEITDVRVERLQEISNEDALAEGVEFHNGGGIGHSGYRHAQSHGFVYGTATEAFKVLWESINGKGSWALNPWVWVMTFKKVGSGIAGRVEVR